MIRAVTPTAGVVLAPNPGPVTLDGTTPALTFIGDSDTMTIKATNSGTSPVNVASVSVGAITLPANCPTGSFSITDLSAPANEIAPGATETVGTATVTFVNKDAVQNACTGFDVDLSSN